MVTLYNTLTRADEPFSPLHDNKVTVYSCGPTVYDYPHIGNWYAFIRWDLLVRMLRASNYSVDWVMNITDVGHLVSDADEGEDKLEKGAKREGKTAWEVAAYYGDYFASALAKLNFSEITHTPKATDYIQAQIDLVKVLENKGYTYKIDDGVYFDTSKFATYNQFARLNVDALKAGARVEFNQQKHSPTDFALWKFSPKDEQRDMEWESPWGKGFPGWHIECSAMSMMLLGDTIDIHTGGIDHIPVHHTNEIAQSEAATGHKFANYWLHSNFVKVDGKKMSKSLGNLVTLEDIEQKGYSIMAFRLLVMESHYRNEANFTWDIVQAAHNRYLNWLATSDLRWQPNDEAPALNTSYDALLHAMQQDLETPNLLELIDQQLSVLQMHGIRSQDIVAYNKFLSQIEQLTGIKLLYPDIDNAMKQLLIDRKEARLNNDWPLSDALRDKIAEKGYSVNDAKNEQRWLRKVL